MTWSQLHERMAFMNALIDHAATDPDAALQSLASMAAQIRRLFGDEEGLLLSLRHRWLTMLAAKLDQAAHDDVPAEHVRAQLAASHPGLRALLDAAARRSVRLRALEHGERHIVDLYAGPTDTRQTVA
jgi:ATP adenylyltransferase